MESVWGSLPLWIAVLPFIGAIFLYLAGQRFKNLRGHLSLLFVGIDFILILSVYPQIFREHKAIGYISPFLSIFQLSLDPLSFSLVALVSFIWLAVSLFSLGYMVGGGSGEYHAFSLVALMAVLGIFLAANFFTLFIFFDILGYVAYILIVNSRTREALKAGTKYLIMIILGDLTFLVGIFLFYYYTGGVAFTPALHLPDSAKLSIFLLMGVGFAVKAGVIPLHIWLPDAHPVAPCPASALLSGLVIKTGVYGIARALLVLFGMAKVVSVVSLLLLCLGVVSMLLAVFMALLQRNAKRMLAYHSISQVGYMIMGLGCAAFLGKEGMLALGASLFHLFNHALFKACLFLGVGAIYLRTGELDMYKLGGLRKKMPLTALFLIVAACGISGVPLFNGYVSKALLHRVLASLGLSPAGQGLLEIVFISTGAATLCSFVKLLRLTLFGRIPESYREVKEVPFTLVFPTLALAAVILTIGLFPNLLWKGLLLPSLEYLGYSPPVLAQFSSVEVWGAHDIGSFLWVLILGLAMYAVGSKYKLFEISFPQWFSVNYWVERLAFDLRFVFQERRVFEALEEIQLAPELKYLAVREMKFFEEDVESVTEGVRRLVWGLERAIKDILLSIKDSFSFLKRYCLREIWEKFLARPADSLAASRMSERIEGYVVELEFGLFLILVFIVACLFW